ncbi:adenosine deaminase family protein [Colletotrichum chrysophilum]|uniref:adenosine deaminase n=1 Tax=Colletotrichum chrysophilum TaxID=1836956 RepID=A0AAD9AG94_9PEZI|nr:Adenosine deaminase 2-A [Colletotrichum sp. SAR11_57]KAK1846385.1 adenosine deaminase family protein [Colletotrichum chrysophilum]
MSLSNEDWEEIRQEIPSTSEPFLAQYINGREALIAQEQKSRSDASFRANSSPIVKRAAAIVARIREEEKKTTWNAQAEEDLATSQGLAPFPGMMFTLAKQRLETTRLWRIVQKMPKGSLLHAHLDAMVDFDFLFEVLLNEPGMHFAANEPLSNEKALATSGVHFRFRNKETSSRAVWDKDYVPGEFRLLTTAADEFPDGGRPGFLKWLKGRCTISLTDSVEQHHGIDAIWRKFADCFTVTNTIIHYEPILRAFLRRLMSSLLADGVFWVEVRFTWPLNYCRTSQEEPEKDYNHMFQVIDEEVKRFKSENAAFWGLRTIWTTLRILPTREIVESMDNCITTKMAWPHLIAGYDLVGQEDLGRPLRDLLPELFWFRKQCAQEGVNLPFFFHAGETLGDGDATDQNLFDAVLLGTRRIGHGFSLYKHPLLIDMVKDKRILVESCPISNEVLRLCGSIMSHPLPALLARGVSCALCNDDPAMLGQDTEGMSHDYWQALQGWENVGLEGLGSLAENSVRWSAFEDETPAEWTAGVKEASLGSGVKAERLKQWSTEWEKFCLWIVEEFGEESDKA